MINHPNEPRGNDLRRRLAASTGRAQRTKSPTLAAITGADGAYLTTADGRRLIDFAAGVLVANLGHNHPGFEDRYRAYYDRLPRTAYNMLTPVEVDAAERLLAALSDNPNAQRVLWAASGSEAVQKAMWAAQHAHPKRDILLATHGGFHGKKGLAGDVTGDQSPNPNVRWVPFPRNNDHPEAYFREALERIATEFHGRIALLITEPYLGAAGSFHPPRWYHQLLQAWCREHDVPFIFDEVQSGFGRTGNMFAYQSYGVQPDLVVLGKGLANGEPCAAVVGRQDLIDALDYGEASDTYSGNPRACAAVCAVLDVFEQENVVETARTRGAELRALLDELAQEFPFITAVRGEGMVYGVEFTDATAANAAVLEAYRGTGSEGVHFLGPLAEKVLRVSPPLTITPEELARGGELLRACWSRVEMPALK